MFEVGKNIFESKIWRYELCGDDVFVNDYRLERTSCACPEQYSVYDKDGIECGYLRLRHGHFRADYPDCGGETLFNAYPDGDGQFSSDKERAFNLKLAICSINKRHTMKF